MKKTTLAIALMLASVGSAQAAVQLSEGTQEISVQGNLNLDYSDEYLLVLDTSYGYFLADDWEVGGNLGVNMSDNNKRFVLGAFTEYNFTNETNWVPYLGASAQFAALSYKDGQGFDGGLGEDGEGDSAALNFKMAAGVKYFINPNVALSAEVNYNIATDDVNVTSDGLSDSFTNIVFGTRFYF
ncbi:opacity family porin [Vibrio sp. TRT 21S02]|uniref:opacity family porin n=1 Tax=unclassified Vibrio TaxID=2614977 RepID=UPI00349F712D